jgi:hypothetical protein
VAKLNASVTTPRVYAPGDKVICYAPQLTAAADAGWRQKHRIQWRGPCTVMTQVNASTYTVKDDATQKVYSRSINALNPYAPDLAPDESDADPVLDEEDEAPAHIPLVAPEELAPAHDAKARSPRVSNSEAPILAPPVAPATLVGSIVAIKDNEEDKAWHLAKVTGLEEDGVAVHYYGTTHRKLQKAKFKPVWIETKSGRSIVGGLRGGERGSPWDGVGHEDLIVLTGITLRRDGAPSAASMRRLQRLKDHKHHYLR